MDRCRKKGGFFCSLVNLIYNNSNHILTKEVVYVGRQTFPSTLVFSLDLKQNLLENLKIVTLYLIC